MAYKCFARSCVSNSFVTRFQNKNPDSSARQSPDPCNISTSVCAFEWHGFLATKTVTTLRVLLLTECRVWAFPNKVVFWWHPWVHFQEWFQLIRWKKGAHVWSQISLQSTARRLLSTLTTYSPDNDQATALIGALQKQFQLRIQFKGKFKEIIHHIPQKSGIIETKSTIKVVLNSVFQLF